VENINLLRAGRHAFFFKRLVLLIALLLGACGDSSDPTTPLFTLEVEGDGSNATLVEGDNAGAVIPIRVSRLAGFSAGITISAEAELSDRTNLNVSVSDPVLDTTNSETTINVTLAVGVAPLQPQTRSIVINASGGRYTTQETITVDITPIQVPDVYLLIGQSNMVGFGGDGEKQAGPNQPDEPVERIRQLNVTKNSEDDVFTSAASYVDIDSIAVRPFIVRAEDPLHTPLDPNLQTKQEDYIGLGLSFAKSALVDTTQNIVLVPAAWSGSAFCSAAASPGFWNATLPEDPDLGNNTWLYDRAVARANLALDESRGVLRGILWHQGETDSDSQFPRCAELYGNNLVNLIKRLRSDIQLDARGAAARGDSSDVPFVLGTMSKGIDPDSNSNGEFPAPKLKVDEVHRSISSLVTHASFADFDDLTPSQGFPCGTNGCIHFGTLAYREMGKRYYKEFTDLFGP